MATGPLIPAPISIARFNSTRMLAIGLVVFIGVVLAALRITPASPAANPATAPDPAFTSSTSPSKLELTLSITPALSARSTCRLFHNLGNGRFEEVTQKAGIYDPTSKSLGVAAIDYDRDGWPDLAVTNDTERNKLYHNNRNGTFTEQGVQAGIAFSEDGIARGAMGIDAVDFDHSGYPSLAIGNFSNQMLGLYHSRVGENWQTVHSGSSYCSQSELTLTFGLRQAAEASSVEIIWPSGQRDSLKNLKANNTYTIQEGGNIISTRSFQH
jgi:hypothetical protein